MGIFKSFSNPIENPLFMRGMTYAGFNPTVFQSEASDEAIVELKKINANWVAINLWWYQDGPNGSEIFRNQNKTVTDESLLHLIKHVQNQGMQIMLKPMVDSLDETWRGKFKPEDSDSWFASYERFITHYAQISEVNKIPLFCIGCEFPFYEKKDQDRWRKIIVEIRENYSGKLTYAANFNRNNSYKKVKFWNDLDYIGIDAYFSVSRKKFASPKRMARGWNRCLRKINWWYWLTRQNKPILFTEIGARSVEGGAKRPWEFDHKRAPNWIEQANYYESFFHSLKRAKHLEGVFWWWWDNPSTGDYIKSGGQNYATSYTPKGKDAEKVLERFYA